MGVIAQTADRYVRCPHLEPTSDGGAVLSVITWHAEHECVTRYAVDADGQVTGDPVATDHGEDLMGFRHTERAVPFADPAEEDRCDRGGWHVMIEREGSVSSVVVASASGDQVTVWRANGIACAPAIVPGKGGAWVAFHHNVREEDGKQDIAKWIALRFVDLQGKVWEPKSAMTDRDRDLRGEEQGYEFPTLVVGADGAVDLFGRGSHNFYRQRVNADGFSERFALDDGKWGCRGRRVAAVRLAGGRTLAARRARRGVELQAFEEPVGGAPELALAVVNIEPPHASAVSVASSWSGPRVLFGDIQQHSAHSDGVGTADEAYLRGRHRYQDDFASLTDHESFLGKRIGPGEWAYLQSVAERHNDPGSFATIVAYEWTGKMYPGPGHKCVYLPGPGYPIVSRDEVPDGASLVQQIKAQGAITGPHHIGWTGADAEAHDPRGQPVWEICSCHGSYEIPENALGYRGELHDQFAKPMLDRGLRFGFMANSDSHGLLWHHGECRKRDPFRTGLTAVLAEECTREAILAALRARRCYATSGEKILLDVSANGQPMGSTIAQSGPIEVNVKARGTSAVSTIELVGPPGVLAVAQGDGLDGSLSATVQTPYVYARVTQDDGEQAWSSPVFVGA